MAKYTINDFFAGKVDVRCNTCKQKTELLKECERRGVVWNDDEKATYHIPEYPVLEIGFYLNGKLTQSNGHTDRNVVDFDQIGFHRHNHYQILIECDGTTTAATMTINGREIKTSIARRNPKDKFDWKKGAELAFERLWNSQRKAEKKPEVREVKRYAKPGEYIKIVENGDILQVTAEWNEGKHDGFVTVKGIDDLVHPAEYVVLEGYRP